ncbi:MAG TPA: RNA pseudouridine synthase [Lentisphaeria bacterium]|nr:MAG: hypothetical protein A2X45_15800 [Lentisphaerae bacterium GWF2_50_93]HCE46420.1 RNA pseudouridine synthase [Lentisphaeria bacterium]
MLEIIVDEKYHECRIDRFLADSFKEYSRTYFQKLLKEGRISCNGKTCLQSKYPVETGNKITIDVPVQKETTLSAQDIPLNVLYEDSDMIVINKDAGIVVHPAAGNHEGTIVNALLGRDEDFADKLEDHSRPGIVHRLDKDTSGCLLVAKNPISMYALSKAFQYRKVKKHYAAIVYGIPEESEEEIMTQIGRHRVDRKKFTVLEKGGKIAISRYKVIKSGEIDGIPVSLLDVEIETGRTHQIRVHLAHKRIPVMGDEVYGGKQKIAAPRQLLHAWKISVAHPVTGKQMFFEAPFPKDFAEFADRIK